MSDKKLLTESEIRRFMALANIPSLGGKATLSEMADPMPSPQQEEAVYQEEAPTMEAEEEMELGDLGAEETPAAGGKEAEFEALVKKLAELVGVDVEVEAGEEESEEAPEMGAGEEESEEGEEEEEAGEEEAEEVEETYGEKDRKMHESKLVDAVLARVTARLVAEAKKKKAAKKMTPAEKMKAMKAAKDKKKKLDEANAPAPKETKPSKEAPEGHGPGKTEHGVHKADSKDQAWGSEKGGHKMEKVAAEAPHSVKKGTNLATLGGHKKVK